MTQPPPGEELRALAQKATAGPWQNGIDDLEGIVAPYNPGLGNVICTPPTKRMYTSLEHWPANAAYIAAANPAAILALLDERDALRKAVERLIMSWIDEGEHGGDADEADCRICQVIRECQAAMKAPAQ